MTKLFVDKSVEINASPQRVWEILTSRDHTREWASEFSQGSPQLHIESDWSLGSAVRWLDKRGNVIIEGVVTQVDPPNLLRFTVSDARGPRSAISADDGITCKLTERDGRTCLWVSQGDFSKMADGAKYRGLSAEIWERALAKIKRLAEGSAQVS